jgi:alanyl-tRNA synthetase
LGEHAEQSGSLVAPDYLRFDFHHFEAPAKKDLESIERIVNEKIMENIELSTVEMPVEEARKTGAKALFGEKYGDRVRVISAGEFSRELCGGTHCGRTGDIGQFKITAEESVAAGIRRITAVTGRYALDYWRDIEQRLRSVADELKTPLSDVVKRSQAVARELKEIRKQLEKQRGGERSTQIGELLASAQTIAGIKVVTANIEGLSAEEMRSAVDVIRKSNQEAVAVLASVTGGKVALIAYAGKKALEKGIDAGKVVREAAKVVGGGGGGRPELAQAGGTDIAKVNDALDLARKMIVEKLGGG